MWGPGLQRHQVRHEWDERQFCALVEAVNSLRREIRMTKDELLASVATAKQEIQDSIASAQAKITEDIVELERRIGAGADLSDVGAAVTDLKETVKTTLGGIDPLPDFPAPPAPTP